MTGGRTASFLTAVSRVKSGPREFRLIEAHSRSLTILLPYILIRFLDTQQRDPSFFPLVPLVLLFPRQIYDRKIKYINKSIKQNAVTRLLRTRFLLTFRLVDVIIF